MAGVIIANPKNNTLNLGDMTTAKSILFAIGFLLILVLEARKIKGSLNFSNITGDYYWNSYGSNKSTNKFKLIFQTWNI